MKPKLPGSLKLNVYTLWKSGQDKVEVTSRKFVEPSCKIFFFTCKEYAYRYTSKICGQRHATQN